MTGSADDAGLGQVLRATMALAAVPVPARKPTPLELEDKFRRRHARNPPTRDQINAWEQLRRRHGPRDQDPQSCRGCDRAPFPCYYHVEAAAALAAFATTLLGRRAS